VSRLGLSIIEEKVEAIRALKFPKTLKDLKSSTGFFNYYRKFVPFHSIITRPLNIIKTYGFKGTLITRLGRDKRALKLVNKFIENNKEKQRCIDA
jgi:hypothetical protein